MASSYPGALDNLPASIGPNTKEDAEGLEHDVMHNRANAAINALQALLGTGSPAATVLARLASLEAGGGGGGGGEDLGYVDVPSTGWSFANASSELVVTHEAGVATLELPWGHSSSGAQGRALMFRAMDFPKPFAVEACIEVLSVGGAYPVGGLALYDAGTGRFGAIYVANDDLNLQWWNNGTSFNSLITDGRTAPLNAGRLWFRIEHLADEKKNFYVGRRKDNLLLVAKDVTGTWTFDRVAVVSTRQYGTALPTQTIVHSWEQMSLA